METNIAETSSTRWLSEQMDWHETNLRVSHDIEERNNVRTPGKVLEDFDFSLDLLLLHWLQNFDNAFLVVDDVDPFKNFRILPAAWPSC